MTKSIFFSLVAIFFLAMCTPKTGEKAQETSPKVGQESFRKQAPAPGPAPKIEIGSYEQFSLDNGLRVIVVENHKLPRVSFQLFVDAPEVHEGEMAGFIDLAGQMLSRGTKNRSKAEIDQEVDFMGASLTTSASGMFGTSLTKHKEGLLDIMADVLLNPSFPETEFTKLKTQTISGLALAKDDPNAIAASVGSVLRFGKDHPYGNIQTETTTEAISLDASRSYYDAYFKPNISYLVVVGDVTVDEVKPLARKYFGAWQKGRTTPKQYDTPQGPENRRVVFVDKPGAVQSVINITYPVQFKPGSEDAVKARVMNTVLGGYFRSRLNNNLREDKGYTYGARSSLSPDLLIGDFNAYASVRNEVTDSSVVEFLTELDRLRKEKLDATELDLVKNYVTGNFALSLENPQTIASFALNTVRYQLPDDYYATYLEKVSQVTADDILEMAQKFVQPDQAYILVVGNRKEVAEKLLPFDTDGTLEYLDYFGNEMVDTDLTLPEGLTANTVIEDYLSAIGGAEKLREVDNLTMEMEAETQMGKIAIFTQVTSNYQFLNTVSMGGALVQKQVFDGEKGKTSGMGGAQNMGEEEVAQMKEDARPFSELNYLKNDYTLTLAGIEMVEGKKAYKIEVESPSGNKKTEYYATDSSLKIREMRETGQGTVTQDYSNYKAVDGILLPHTMVLTGGMPVPLKLELQKGAFNTDLAPDTFTVE